MERGTLHHRSSEGALLAEWIVAVALVSVIAVMGGAMMMSLGARHDLNGCTEDIVYELRKVQLWSMLGHRREGANQCEFILKRRSYSVQEGYQAVPFEVQLPDYIESARNLTVVIFSAYGLPYDASEITLYDRRTGAKNRIWISVQTGRIRWEEVPQI